MDAFPFHRSALSPVCRQTQPRRRHRVSAWLERAQVQVQVQAQAQAQVQGQGQAQVQAQGPLYNGSLIDL